MRSAESEAAWLANRGVVEYLPCMKPLPLSFYRRPALMVARDLLGCILVRRDGTHVLSGRIVEVEAYTQNDPASHSFRGRTPRNDVMFQAGGVLYVYFTYGMHFCANVVTGPEGRGEAVLLRAVEPVEGIDVMRTRRNRPDTELANGPAKLCQAFDLGRAQNGLSLVGPEIQILPGRRILSKDILRTPRIGVTAGQEKLWRFVLEEKTPRRHRGNATENE